jgi:hypothetical protein
MSTVRTFFFIVTGTEAPLERIATVKIVPAHPGDEAEQVADPHGEEGAEGEGLGGDRRRACRRRSSSSRTSRATVTSGGSRWTIAAAISCRSMRPVLSKP